MKQYHRLPFLLLSMLILITVPGCSQTHIRSTDYSYQKPAQIDDGLSPDHLLHVNMDTGIIVELTKLILADSFPNIHSVLIAKDNMLVYENYFSGKDESWGSSLGYTMHDTNKLHDSRSISKSVVAACIDIAIQHKQIISIDDPIFNYLPGYTEYKTPLNEKITIRHLLTMSSGIQWNENTPHGTSANNETQMERSLNPVKYVLQQPMSSFPGSVWNYNSGSVQVLAEIIKNVSGLDVDLFASKFLFQPLNIQSYKWTRSSNTAILFHLTKIFNSRRSFPAAASGLRLTSRSLLKIGLLYLNNGAWNNIQVLSKKWVQETFKTQILRGTNSSANGYSYLFWTHTDTVNNWSYPFITARGNGGQRIFICQPLHLVVVITAGNYNKRGIRNDGQFALDNYIIPASIQKKTK